MDPSTVWMVHRATPGTGVRGELYLETGHLVFRPDVRSARIDTLGQTILAFEEITKVKRARGSPVLEIHNATPDLPGVVLFYFAKPPDMHSSVSWQDPRAHGARFLGASNTLLGEDVDAWAAAIRAATRG